MFYEGIYLTGFEPHTSGVGSDHFVNWVTTTAHKKFYSCSTSHVTTALLTTSLPFYHQCNYCCVNHVTTGLCQQRHCRSTYQQLHYVSTSHATTAILIWSPKILSTMSLLLFQPHHCSVKNVTNDLPMRSLSTNQPRHYRTIKPINVATTSLPIYQIHHYPYINYITTNECINYINTIECHYRCINHVAAKKMHFC